MRTVAALVAVLTVYGLALAQPASPAAVSGPPTLRITGQVRHPVTLTLAELQALPATDAQWMTRSGQVVRTGQFDGPLLWELVKAADPVDVTGPGAAGRSHLQHVLMARGADGYAVAVAIGDVDPEFEAKKVIVALPGPDRRSLQVVVPNDSRGGRGVRDLMELDVR